MVGESMKYIKDVVIKPPIHIQPGDTLSLNYEFSPELGSNLIMTTKYHIEKFEEPMTIDTLKVYEIEPGEYQLKAGRALIMGEAE